MLCDVLCDKVTADQIMLQADQVPSTVSWHTTVIALCRSYWISKLY